MAERKHYDEQTKAAVMAAINTSCFVYGLRSADLDKYFYVGSTKHDPQARLADHLNEVKYGLHSNKHFVNKVKKIGAANIVCDILETTDPFGRWGVEATWIKNLSKEGHKLVNRIHNEVEYQFEDYRTYRLPYERWLKILDAISKPPPRAKNPKLQKLANLAHEVLCMTVHSSLENGIFPLPEWGEQMVSHDR